jgi:hypothetical protein
MAEDRITLRAIAWQQVFPSLRLFSALRMALNFKALVLAAIAAAGMVAGWRILGEVFVDPESPALVKQFSTWPWDRPLFYESVGQPADPAAQLDTSERPSLSGSVSELASPGTWIERSPLVLAWTEISAPFRQMYETREASSVANFTYLLCCGLWSLLVWAFFGAAITRQAAVAFARQENTSLAQLAVFASPRWTSYFVAPLFPILGTILMAAFMAVLGLLMRMDIGILLASIVWPLVLLGGFMMAFLLIGLFFGFPLMWGSISAEGTDAFGALSHSYSYVYQRPLHYLVYVVIASIVGVLGWYLVSLFIDWILVLSTWGISWGSGVEQWTGIRGPETMGRIADTGAAIIGFWTNCLHAVAYGFVFSYFWSATTVIYFLLRRLVDATELDEVFMPEEHEQHGLPPLKTGPDGMPTVVDDPVLSGDESNGGQKART